MRAILIDSHNRVVKEIDVGKPILQTLQFFVEGWIERATSFPNHDDLFVNEEGLLHDEVDFFDIGAHQPFAGNGVIIGNKGGKTTAAVSSLAEITAKVSWLKCVDVSNL